MNISSQNTQVYFAAILSTCLVLMVNSIIPSFMNGFTPGLNFDLGLLFENARAEELYHARNADSEFARKLTVLNFQKLTSAIGLPFQFSFNLINIGGLYLLFSQSYRLASKYYNRLNPWVFQLFLATCFPILFAFLPVIFTYDDIIQFLLLVVFIGALYENQKLKAYSFYFLACLSKETTLFFSIFLLVYFLKQKDTFKASVRALIPYALLSLMYLFIIYFIFDNDLKTGTVEYMVDIRFFFFRSNFYDIYRVIEIFLYTASVYTLPLILISKRKIGANQIIILQSFIALSLFNLLIALVAAEAVEARIYFMTLIPLFPMLAEPMNELFIKLKKQKGIFPLSLGISMILSACLIALYHPQVERAFYVFAPYLFLYFSFCFYLIFKKRFHPL